MTHSNTAEEETMSLVLSAEEESLREAVRGLLGKHLPWQDVLQNIASGRLDDTQVWKRLSRDMGLAGLVIPEDMGGQGASWREAAVVAQEIGRAVAPVPYFSSAVLATAVLLELEASELLSAMAAGEAVTVCAVPFAGDPGTTVSDVVVVDDVLTGTVRGVADAESADHFLVPTDDGLHVVEAGDARIRSAGAFDPTRPLFDVEFERVRGNKIAERPEAQSAMERGLLVGSALLTAEMVGVGQAALDSVIEYLKHRVQFGRVIGSYQAIKHQLVDAWMLLEQADAAARYAADCIASRDGDQALATSVAKSYASEAVVSVTEKVVQLHGGIGFTWENASHLYLKRAKANSLGMGTSGHHSARVGELVDLQAPV